jgi:hypothetical protein
MENVNVNKLNADTCRVAFSIDHLLSTSANVNQVLVHIFVNIQLLQSSRRLMVLQMTNNTLTLIKEH